MLVTGGSGSFGQAFVRRVLASGLAERVCVYSRGEHAQAAMREAQPDSRIRWFIGDVRDRDRLRRAMDGCDTVVHAAALKRIEVGAYGPDEMVKTNVLGAMNVIEAASSAGVRHVVALSTDKAWQPISPYGQSKALAESLFLAANKSFSGPTFGVVRYGNVWNSAGSIVPTWAAMIESGATAVPVTDPDCTRFFMLMDEAIDLVLDSIGKETITIPEWLPAYRVGDLATAMGVDMRITGLPWWEKKAEGMRDDLTSDRARRMAVDELIGRLEEAGYRREVLEEGSEVC